MSTLKISKHSDVPVALDLVREEVDKEARRIFSAGGDALKEGKIKPAKEAIAYAEKLNLNKRFDLLMETVDKTKAKAYIEKIRGGITIKPKDVMIEADEILRDFLIV